jgi:YHS domain-containing protein
MATYNLSLLSHETFRTRALAALTGDIPPTGSSIENIRRKTMANTTHTDPVCRMEINEEDAEATAEHNGQTFYFCSQQCADKFTRNPQQYTQAA